LKFLVLESHLLFFSLKLVLEELDLMRRCLRLLFNILVEEVVQSEDVLVLFADLSFGLLFQFVQLSQQRLALPLDLLLEAGFLFSERVH
jgi:hypothetical protein